MSLRTLTGAVCAALTLSLLPVSAGAQPLTLNSSAGAATAVATFYQAHRLEPIWLRGGAGTPAAGELISILKRAELDGFADGPRLAAQAEQAIARAAGGDPRLIAEAEQLLSTAWVRYVRALRRPSPAMVYAVPALAPKPPAIEMILAAAAAAPSLERHLREVAAVNPLYAELRNAAWSRLQSTGESPDARVLASLDRARTLPSEGRYIVVDAASARLFMFEDGRIRDSMRVIVGKRGSQTPMLASTIHYATFNPYWNVPADLVRKTIAANVLKYGHGYLRDRGYELLSGFGDNPHLLSPEEVDWKAVAAGRETVRVRELPGKGNSMGEVKFGLTNGRGIFLHDTPKKELFDKSQRTLSSGCIRLEDAGRLARWLLGREPVDYEGQAEKHVQLPQGVPVYITYLTATEQAGEVAFTDDVYGRDLMWQARVARR